MNTAVSGLSLSKATVLIDHDVRTARERLERAISKAWRTPEGQVPQPSQCALAHPSNVAAWFADRGQSVVRGSCAVLGII
jgi:hypothetical protein